MRRVREILKWVLPFAVSGGILAYLLAGMDMRGLVEHVTLDVFLVLIPALLIFGAISLFIEAVCLVRLVPTSREVFMPPLSSTARTSMAGRHTARFF